MTRLLGRIALGVAAICLAATTTTSWAEVTLSTVLSDHMVLQRERPIHLWGTADPAEKVTVAFKGNWATTEADSFGRWSVYLPGSPAGGPFPLVVEAKNTIRFDDVLVGDIWVASGQSNMEFPMKQTPPWSSAIRNMQRELAGASHPRIRLFHVQKTASDFPRVNPDAGPWSVCTPENVANFSAVAYFFAVEIEQKQHVPIGVIEASWGGTPAEAWTSLDALSADASLMPVFRYRAHMMEDEPTTLLKLQMMQAEVDRQVALGKAASMPWHLDPNAWAPAALFNGMIAPITPFPIRGVIWYQGESNTNPEQVPIYAHLFQSLIQDWRAKWKIGDFPFLFAQIANYRYGEEWPAIREAQRRSLALTNTGMAVTIDIGDAENIHPPDKQDVGHRLAILARAISYGENIEASGPLFRQAVTEGAQMRIWFDHVGAGLSVKGDRLQGFEVAGSDGKFVSAEAEVLGENVTASSPLVKSPVYVRYGWAADPHCNLYNQADLPASPFTSEQ